MAIVQSAWGSLRKQAPVSREAGGVVAEKYKFVIDKNLAAGDIIELAVLPSYHTVVDATLLIDDIGTATVDVGVMSSVPGDPAQNRTSGNELFAGAAKSSVTRMSKPDGFRIPAIEGDRSIGVKVQGAGIARANQVIELILYTKQ